MRRGEERAAGAAPGPLPSPLPHEARPGPARPGRKRTEGGRWRRGRAGRGGPRPRVRARRGARGVEPPPPVAVFRGSWRAAVPGRPGPPSARAACPSGTFHLPRPPTGRGRSWSRSRGGGGGRTQSLCIFSPPPFRPSNFRGRVDESRGRGSDLNLISTRSLRGGGGGRARATSRRDLFVGFFVCVFFNYFFFTIRKSSPDLAATCPAARTFLCGSVSPAVHAGRSGMVCMAPLSKIRD